MGDRSSLDLIGRQNELVSDARNGKPVIVLCSMAVRIRSITLPKTFGYLQCGIPGRNRRVVAALFGDINPSVAPITIPRSSGIPLHYNHKPYCRGYLFDDVSPLFAFGYGLSYTSFSIESASVEKEDQTTVGPILSDDNTGKREGSEVVQMYIRDRVSSVTRPVKELKGFQKVFLEPRETKTVQLEITPESLAFWDVNMRYTVEPGEFEIMVGNSSSDPNLQKAVLTVTN
jgi:beta-glucosidase